MKNIVIGLLVVLNLFQIFKKSDVYLNELYKTIDIYSPTVKGTYKNTTKPYLEVYIPAAFCQTCYSKILENLERISTNNKMIDIYFIRLNNADNVVDNNGLKNVTIIFENHSYNIITSIYSDPTNDIKFAIGADPLHIKSLNTFYKIIENLN